jgi:tetratricopeptide (TPR) repeat protein
MKRTAVFLLCAGMLFLGCQQKEESKPQYQFPVGQGQPGGMQPGSAQSVDIVKLLQDAVKKDPKNLHAWIELGNTLMDTRRFPEAVEAYQKALELDPKNVDVRVDMGTCYRNSGKPDLAVKEYKKALENNPNHLNGHLNLAIVLAFDIHDYPQAQKVIEKAIAMAPNSPEAQRVRQEIERMKGTK